MGSSWTALFPVNNTTRKKVGVILVQVYSNFKQNGLKLFVTPKGCNANGLDGSNGLTLLLCLKVNKMVLWYAPRRLRAADVPRKLWP